MKLFSYTIGLFIFFAVSISLPAIASPPGGGEEGPAGNSWKAVVIEISKGKPREIKVKLKESIGSCMYTSHEGSEGQTINLPVGDHSQYKLGDVIEIWLYPQGKGSLQHPKCK